jgi:peptidoglycan/LPS O-acetylase OafA/YrhL
MAFPDGTGHPLYLLQHYGWIGVDFFFSISGFVICMIVTRKDFSRTEFFIKRAFRLYPLWIASCLFLIYIAYHPRGFQARDSWAFIAYSLTLLPTYAYPFHDVGWSIQHEVMFYIAAALVIPRFGLVGLTSLLAIIFAIAKTIDAPPWWLTQFTAYYPLFIAGILAFATYRRLPKLNALAMLGVGSALLFVFTSYYFGATAFPVAFFFLVLGFVNLEIKTGSIAGRIGVTLGDASYGIYLLHPLVFWYVFWCLRTWWKWAPLWSAEIFRYGAIFFTCWLAIKSWQLFERPMIKIGDEMIRERRRKFPAASLAAQLP